MTNSTFWLGVVSFAEFLPILLVSPLIGDAIDRRDKKNIIVCFEVLPAVAMLFLLVLLLLGALTLPLLFTIAFVVGTSMAVSHPAQLAWYPTLLQDRSHIGSAANIYILSLNLARFVGAGLAGAVISIFGVESAVALTAVGYLTFVAVLMTIPQRDKAPAQTHPGNALSGAVAGMRYAIGRRVLGMTLLIIAITSAGARGIPELAPAITERQLGLPAEVFSVLIAVTGLGSVIAGCWNLAARDQSTLTAIRQTVIFGLVLAPCAIGIAFAETLWLAVLLFTALGFAITVTAVKSQQVIQSLVDDSMRGQVNTLYFLSFRGGAAFGALWMGTVSSGIGLSATLVIGGVLCAGAWWLTRDLATEAVLPETEKAKAL
jgi:predicted MFS family arabinose efflux permease